jgi:hypothetical protein
MSDLPTEISIAEQAEKAGRRTQAILPAGVYPDLDALREHIKDFMPDGKSQAGMMARAKAMELDFWLRAGRQRAANEADGVV